MVIWFQILTDRNYHADSYHGKERGNDDRASPHHMCISFHFLIPVSFFSLLTDRFVFLLVLYEMCFLEMYIGIIINFLCKAFNSYI